MIEDPISWREPWYPVEDANLRAAIQAELAREVGPLHPLRETEPVVIGKRDDCDDVVVSLSNHRFAIVHLVWHGGIDHYSDQFPRTRIFDGIDALQQALDIDNDDWAVGEGSA